MNRGAAAVATFGAVIALGIRLLKQRQRAVVWEKDGPIPESYKRIVLVSRPETVAEEKHFRFEEVKTKQPGEGELLVKTLYLSLDPYVRGRLGDDKQKTYVAPVAIGDTICGHTIGRVMISNDSRFAAGDIVATYSGWREYDTVSAAGAMLLERAEDAARSRIPPDQYLNVLGMPGKTAHYGLFLIGQAKPTDTVVVSTAAGAVGSVVCQLARNLGCKVIGITGSKDKQQFLQQELGIKDTLNYKDYNNDSDALGSALDKLAPGGVDLYFDNTGGWISDAVMARINSKARIVVCGQITSYNNGGKSEMGPRLNHLLLWRKARMEGFLVSEYKHKDPETVAELKGWLLANKLVGKQEIVHGGLKQAYAAFMRLFTGENQGKMVLAFD